MDAAEPPKSTEESRQDAAIFIQKGTSSNHDSENEQVDESEMDT